MKNLTQEKKQLGIIRFFSGYIKNFGKIFLTNAIFAVPVVLFSVGFYYLNVLSGINMWFVMFLPIIFVFPFFAGVTLITRNMVRGDDRVPVFKLFFKGLKDNFLQFFVHGILLYIAFFLCYISITMYWDMAQTNGIFYVTLGVTVIITLALLFAFYNLPVMTVTFDLPLKHIYKNSFLMSFGELKNNFFATLGLFLLCLCCVTVFLSTTNSITFIITSLIVGLLIIPATASYIINFYVYEDMENLMANKTEKEEEIKRQLEEKRTGVKIPRQPVEKLDFSQLDLDERKDGEEYLFFNGKMMKRKVLIEMKKQQENSNE